MIRETQECISGFEQQILERLVKLETSVDLGFKSTDKALVLARETLEKDRILTKKELDANLSTLTLSEKNFGKLERTFATKDEVAKEFRAINRVIYIGVGVFIAFEFIFKYVIK